MCIRDRVILEGGDIAAVQLLDQVQGTGQAQLRRMTVHALLDVYKRQGKKYDEFLFL